MTNTITDPVTVISPKEKDVKQKVKVLKLDLENVGKEIKVEDKKLKASKANVISSLSEEKKIKDNITSLKKKEKELGKTPKIKPLEKEFKKLEGDIGEATSTLTKLKQNIFDARTQRKEESEKTQSAFEENRDDLNAQTAEFERKKTEAQEKTRRAEEVQKSTEEALITAKDTLQLAKNETDAVKEEKQGILSTIETYAKNKIANDEESLKKEEELATLNGKVEKVNKELEEKEAKKEKLDKKNKGMEEKIFSISERESRVKAVTDNLRPAYKKAHLQFPESQFSV